MAINNKPRQIEWWETILNIDLNHDIKTKLATLNEITSTSNKLKTLTNATKYFKNNPEAQKIINTWLQEIINQIEKIKTGWEESIHRINLALANHMEKSEREDWISPEQILNNIT